MKSNRLIAALLALILLCMPLCGCGGRGTDEPSEPLLPQIVKPIDAADRLDYTDNETLSAKVELLRDSFVSLDESPEADFWYRVEDGKAILIAYTGEAAHVRVPETLGGVPLCVIESEAFADKTTLQSLYLPDSITSFGKSVLEGCEKLKALRTPFFGATAESAQFLGYLFGSTAYENNSRDVVASLEYLEIGGNARRLADFSLFECNDLVCVSLPLQMTEIGRYAMYGCSRLVALNTEHLTLLDANALDSCTALTRLEFGSSMTTFGLGALEGCTDLRRLILPFVGGSRTDNTYLAYLFGAETPEFARGFYPNKLVDVTVTDGATALGNYAFYDCVSLTEITLPATLTKIGLRAFDGCGRLQAISLPQALTEIGASAFNACFSLTTVTFAEQSALQTIGINAFYRCHALEKISLPQSLSSIPASCFADCIALAEVDLGGVRTVGKNAFHRCQSLQTVHADEGLTVGDGNPILAALLSPQKK